MRLWILLLALAGCVHPRDVGPSADEQARLSVDAALAGTWQLSNYAPTQPMTGALLAAIQTGRVLATFANGHMKSTTPDFTFDRTYRIEPPVGDTFRIWLSDGQGLEYESWARFSGANRLLFDCKNEPWRGTGSIERVPTP